MGKPKYLILVPVLVLAGLVGSMSANWLLNNYYSDEIAALQQETEEFRAEVTTLKLGVQRMLAEHNLRELQQQQPKTVTEFLCGLTPNDADYWCTDYGHVAGVIVQIPSIDAAQELAIKPSDALRACRLDKSIDADDLSVVPHIIEGVPAVQFRASNENWIAAAERINALFSEGLNIDLGSCSLPT